MKFFLFQKTWSYIEKTWKTLPSPSDLINNSTKLQDTKSTCGTQRHFYKLIRNLLRRKVEKDPIHNSFQRPLRQKRSPSETRRHTPLISALWRQSKQISVNSRVAWSTWVLGQPWTLYLTKEVKEIRRWEDVLCSWTWRINIVKMTILPQMVHRLNVIPLDSKDMLHRTREKS